MGLLLGSVGVYGGLSNYEIFGSRLPIANLGVAGGNSGGPVYDANSGKVVGIFTGGAGSYPSTHIAIITELRYHKKYIKQVLKKNRE